MYSRTLTAPESAFFLFGPRGTGKSTWIKQQFADGYLIDLLPSDVALRYQRDPRLIRAEIAALAKDRWVILDEVQKVPQLLDDIHFMYEQQGYRKFVLTGSSVRKLKRGAANLLAGRAVLRKMRPLTSRETNFALPVDRLLTYGCLPVSVTCRTDDQREDYLQSYVVTYLNEEIKHEGLVRQIGSFARFLDVAALAAGQQTNVAGLARDAGVARDTVRGYFSIFTDTLLGTWLPAYRPKAKVKEVATPKFYWFDAGVLHAAAGGFTQPLPREWQGVLLEHLVYHELQAYLDDTRSRGSLGFWRTPAGSEIDFIWWYGEERVAIEVKAADRFRPALMDGIRSFSQGSLTQGSVTQGKALKRSFVVYRGEKELKVDQTWVLPVEVFLQKLHRGEIVGRAR